MGSAASRGRRLWPALFLLGFASGLPQPLVDATLTTWLSKVGYTPAEIVRVGFVTLPFALKPLWAPLVDRVVPPLLGRRRGWLCLCQLVLIVALGALALVDPLGERRLLVLVALVAALASATQDLVVNGYTCDSLPSERLPAGVGLSVWGYRVAWLVSGGLALLAADRWGWPSAYGLMTALLALGLLGTWLAPEPEGIAPPATLREAVVEPWRAFERDLGSRGLALLALFVLLYRLPDGLANLLAPAFQSQLFDLTSLGLARGFVGLAGAAVGAALAAWATPRLGMGRALFWFALAQALSNLGYVGLDQGWWSGLAALFGVQFVENVCGALAATVFVAYLMGFCRSASAATQYALLSALTLLGPHLLREPIRGLMETTGWSAFFLLTTAAVVPGLVLLARLPLRPVPPAATR